MRLVDIDKVIEDVKLYSVWHEEKDLIPVSYIKEQIKEYEKNSEIAEDPKLKRIYSEQAHALRMLVLYWKLQ